jgi:exosortase/archaeosortase family protein
MRRDVYLFLLEGVVIFLFLEILLLPLRSPIVSLLQSYLPAGFTAVWPCTGLDEVLLFLSFLFPYPSRRSKLLPALLGVLIIEAYNVLRILIVIKTSSPLLHDLLFRWGGFLLVILLFYFTFRYLSPRPELSRRPSPPEG